MISPIIAAVAFFAISLSLVGYLFAARQGRKTRIDHPDDFFLARQRMSADDLGDTQIAYALQMSTIYPFFILAASGAWIVPVLNSVCWFIGILLFVWWVPRFKPFLGRSITIHSFIAQVNSSPSLRRFASWMSVIAFAGVVIFELAYGASVFRVLFGDNRIVYYVLVAFLAAYLASYLWNGGQTATLRTEQLQLLMAYLGLHFAVSHLFLGGEVQIESIVPTLVPVLVLIASLVMLWSRAKTLRRALRAGRRLMGAAYALMILSLSTVLYALITSAPRLNYERFFTADSTTSTMGAVDLWMMIATAVCLPIFWQFIDLTNWQRIASLSATSSNEYADQARTGLKEYLIESPLSWLLAVLLGIMAPKAAISIAGSGDGFEDFIRHFLTENGLPQVVGIFVTVGIVGVFMSTADAAITAIGYACAYDLYKPTQMLIDQTTLSKVETIRVISAGRWSMVIAVAIVVLMFIAIDWGLRGGETFIGLLFAFYTPLIALSPAVMCPVLVGYRPAGFVVFGSIAAGAVVGLGIGLYAALGHQEYQWYPAPIAFATSWLLYALGLCFSRQRVEVNTAQRGGRYGGRDHDSDLAHRGADL